MKLCPECSNSPWPFVMVFFLASVSAFVTWLTLSYSQLGTLGQIAGSAVAFMAVGGTLLHYVLSCMRRHCRHGQQEQTGHKQGAAH
jgi:hypothetical protein